MSTLPLKGHKWVNPVTAPALVSIIIPNYNHAHYIGDAIQSVLQQDYAAVEIIVVDDGSTDASQEVVARFGDAVRYIYQENRGLSAARNTGLAAAKGAYIGVLDADDMYEPNFLSTLAPILAANPNVAAVTCGYQFVDELNRSLPQSETRLLSPEEFYSVLSDGNFLVPEAILVRRACYEAVGPFDEALRACEDWDMWLRIAKTQRVLTTGTLLTRHRVLPNSMSTDPVRMRTNRFAVLKKHFGPEMPVGMPPSPEHQRAYARAYWCTAVEYLQHHDVDGAYASVCKMFQILPELVAELDVFYDLACGEQPKGLRGDPATFDGQRNAALLIGMLDKMFQDQALAEQMGHRRALAYANAYWALGLLSYRARDLNTAKRFLPLALQQQGRYRFKWPIVSILVKSYIGKTGIEWLSAKRKTLHNLLRYAPQ